MPEGAVGLLQRARSETREPSIEEASDELVDADAIEAAPIPSARMEP